MDTKRCTLCGHSERDDRPVRPLLGVLICDRCLGHCAADEARQVTDQRPATVWRKPA